MKQNLPITRHTCCKLRLLLCLLRRQAAAAAAVMAHDDRQGKSGDETMGEEGIGQGKGGGVTTVIDES